MVNFYLQMEKYRIEPDAVPISSILSACGDLLALSLGRGCMNMLRGRNYDQIYYWRMPWLTCMLSEEVYETRGKCLTE